MTSHVRLFKWTTGISASVLLLLLLLLLPNCSHAFRPAMSRAKVLAMLGEEQTRRLYFSDCEQSSRSSSCRFSIDSSVSQESTQCAVTDPEEDPYWVVYLEMPSYITRVTLLNMDQTYQSYRDGLTNMMVRANSDVCIRYVSDEPFTKWTFPCDSMAQWISIRSHLDPAVLAVCDVEVYGVPLQFPTVLGDAKLLTPVSCEITSVEGNGYCENAFDGDTNRNHQAKACAVTTAQQSSPWIRAVLAKPSFVVDVTVHSRGDCCGDGLTNFLIELDYQVCGEYEGAVFESQTVACRRFGRNLRLMSLQDMPMSICEIQIMGYEPKMEQPEKFKSLGCYKDKMKDHDLSQLVSSTRMSYKKCYTMCKRLGLKHFGVQNGVHCWCGSSFGKHGKVANSTCSVQCDGNDRETCGGPLLNNVFEIL